MPTKLISLFLGALLFFATSVYASDEIQASIYKHLQNHQTFSKRGNTFQILKVSTSKTAEHIWYQHMYLGIPVWNSIIAFHIINQQNKILIDDALKNPVELDLPPAINNIIIFKSAEQYVYATKNYARGKYTYNDTFVITNLTGVRLSTEPTRRFNHGPDSLVSLPVFTPNPVEILKKPYGYPLNDQNDKNSKILEKAYKWKEIPLTSDGNNYFLKHPLFKFKEVSAPFDSAHIFSGKTLPLNRQDAGFEAINSFYHLSQYAEYIHRLGYDNLLDTLIIDSHGLNGDDQSAFNGSTYPGTLEFGQGGVDDAEDGHVVIHEFVHSMVHKIQVNGFIGEDRQAMEEGLADYLALSYSNLVSGNNTSKIFTWDGHNEFWLGFELETEKTYFDKTGDVYNDREIWSSALFCISQNIGYDKTDELILEQIFYQKANATMPEMANNLLFLDSIMNLAVNYQPIKKCFIQKRILKGNYKDIQFDHGTSLQFKVLDNQPELFGTPLLTVVFNRSTTFIIEIYDITGKLVFTKQYSGELATINKNQFKSGMYQMRIRQDSTSEVPKNWPPVKIAF